MKRLTIILVAVAVVGTFLRQAAAAQKAAGIPDQAIQALEQLVGKWNSEGKSGGKEQTGEVTLRWFRTEDRQKVCLIGNFAYKTGDEVRSGVTLIGWNAAKKCIEDRGFDCLGGNAVLLWTLKSPTLWQGDVTIVENGQTIKAKADLVIKGPAEVVYEAELENGDTARVEYRKVVKPRKKNAEAADESSSSLVDCLADATLHALNGKFAEAEQCYRSVLESHAAELSAQQQLNVTFLLAKAIVAQGARQEEACELLAEMLQRHRGALGEDDPDLKRASDMRRDEASWFVWSTCLNADSEPSAYAKAVEYAREGIKLAEADAPVPLWALAFAQLRSGDKEASLATMKQALAVEPVEPGEFMWMVMAMIEKAHGNDDIARALHVAASRCLAKTRSTWEPALNMQKQTATATGLSASYPPEGWEEKDCLAAFETLLTKYPNFPRLHGYCAAILAGQKKWKEAIAEYARGAALAPDEFRHLEELTGATRPPPTVNLGSRRHVFYHLTISLDRIEVVRTGG